MSTFTVYCHGTGFNRTKGSTSNELVAWFHNHNAGVEASLAGGAVTRGDYLINEGPGHGDDKSIAQPQQINPITGDRKKNLSLLKVLTRPTLAVSASTGPRPVVRGWSIRSFPKSSKTADTSWRRR